MKTLILFRHGKSDWESDSGGDMARRLNERGVGAARVMGRFLARAGQVPDSAVTSPAVRARTTLDLAVEAGGWSSVLRVADALYDASPSAVLEVVRAEPDTTRSLLLTGHEPTWSAMLQILALVGKTRFPTAAMARVDLDVESWRDASLGRGELLWLVPPKLLLAGEDS